MHYYDAYYVVIKRIDNDEVVRKLTRESVAKEIAENIKREALVNLKRDEYYVDMYQG
ncbi:hypothetical protein [Paenibacillus xylanexedens]|uniref:hypothetical protein n=1 Tax=Paenibacillus xylanexedens TaxID=528191 RepID=UPI000F9EC197|nr:hypothetical protein [Paenibacillus xylanexedens]RPK20118.1 hypothetical protein EDO6_06657 [Paenibacillus xylanexedens]